MGARALLVAIALVVGLSASCSDDDDPSPAATVPSGSEAAAGATTSTTVGVDEVPAEITVEYVQRVMDALDASWGDMYRLYVDSGGPTAETAAWLAELYTPDEYSVMDVELGREAADGFSETREETGEPVTRVETLISADAECIYFEGIRHYAEIFDFAPSPAETRGVVALRARGSKSEQNRTAWAIAYEADASSGRPEGNPCA